MVLQWGGGQPDDRDVLEPVFVEDGDQGCATLYRNGNVLPALHDQDCDDAASLVVCEDASPQPCVSGGACLLALGCAGVFDCALPSGQQCAPAPASETCNGEDDDCDGQVDAAIAGPHACQCVTSTDPGSGRKYKACSLSRPYREANCGPGYRLAVIDNTSEQAYVAGLLGNADAAIGLFQLTDAATPGARWFWVDGTPLATDYWLAAPDDGDGVEDDEENCAFTEVTGWGDRSCTALHPYVCEQI